MTTKHCSSCQKVKPLAGGVFVPTNKGKSSRWTCADCKEGRAQQAKMDKFKWRQENVDHI